MSTSTAYVSAIARSGIGLTGTAVEPGGPQEFASLVTGEPSFGSKMSLLSTDPNGGQEYIHIHISVQAGEPQGSLNAESVRTLLHRGHLHRPACPCRLMLR